MSSWELTSSTSEPARPPFEPPSSPRIVVPGHALAARVEVGRVHREGGRELRRAGPRERRLHRPRGGGVDREREARVGLQPARIARRDRHRVGAGIGGRPGDDPGLRDREPGGQPAGRERQRVVVGVGKGPRHVERERLVLVGLDGRERPGLRRLVDGRCLLRRQREGPEVLAAALEGDAHHLLARLERQAVGPARLEGRCSCPSRGSRSSPTRRRARPTRAGRRPPGPSGRRRWSRAAGLRRRARPEPRSPCTRATRRRRSSRCRRPRSARRPSPPGHRSCRPRGRPRRCRPRPGRRRRSSTRRP